MNVDECIPRGRTGGAVVTHAGPPSRKKCPALASTYAGQEPESERYGLPAAPDIRLRLKGETERAATDTDYTVWHAAGLGETREGVLHSSGIDPPAETGYAARQEGLPAPALRDTNANIGDVESEAAEELTEAGIENLREVFDHEIAVSTRENYLAQWRRFAGWAFDSGVTALPAEPESVADYLRESIERDGHKPATIRVSAAAISFVHRAASMDNPCSAPDVKRALRGATRTVGRFQRQAEALTSEALAIIQTTAYEQRTGRGGRLESKETARLRGGLDIVMISLMRDAMLRVSEAAALTWADLKTESDGTGRLLIRRSKTDSEGEGSVMFVSAPTMAFLKDIRDGASSNNSILGLRPNQIAKRIKQAARVADLGEGFSGHSPRVGMARDLARAGIELAQPYDGGTLAVAQYAGAVHPERDRGAGSGSAVLRLPSQGGLKKGNFLRRGVWRSPESCDNMPPERFTADWSWNIPRPG